jgi:hypothetical protein
MPMQLGLHATAQPIDQTTDKDFRRLMVDFLLPYWPTEKLDVTVVQQLCEGHRQDKDLLTRLPALQLSHHYHG